MFPFILPSPSAASGAAGQPRTNVELGSGPLRSPTTLQSGDIAWHPQPSPSLRSVSALHHADQSLGSASDIASRSFVEFHHAGTDADSREKAEAAAGDLHLNTTHAQTAEVSVASRRGMSVSEQAGSMPASLAWPSHLHTLQYAGTSSGDSVRVCICRNCRGEHYNTAVYSCTERACAFHVCLACALEQLSAVNEARRELNRENGLQIRGAAGRSPKAQRNADVKREQRDGGGGGGGGGFEWQRGEVGEGELIMKDVPTFDVCSPRPLSYSRDRLQKEYASTRHWLLCVEHDASQLRMRLSLSCSLHAEHPLLYQPVSNSQFCDAVLSPHCVSHDLNKHYRPAYCCLQCQYRLCLPCYRWYLLDSFSRLRASLSYETAALRITDLMSEYRRSRALDAQSLAYSQHAVDNSSQLQLRADGVQSLVIAAVSGLLCIALVNALLTLPAASSVSADDLLNVIVILVASAAASLAAFSLGRHVQQIQQRFPLHHKAIDAIYADPALSYFFTQNRPKALQLTALTPRQRDRISDLYSHQVNVLVMQSNTVYYRWLFVLLCLLSSGLMISGIVYLFISVLCSLSVYDDWSNCQVRTAVPVAVLLFAVVIWRLWLQLIARAWGAFTRERTRAQMYRREERHRTKWQRRE